jgi:hypothetical protein
MMPWEMLGSTPWKGALESLLLLLLLLLPGVNRWRATSECPRARSGPQGLPACPKAEARRALQRRAPPPPSEGAFGAAQRRWPDGGERRIAYIEARAALRSAPRAVRTKKGVR